MFATRPMAAASDKRGPFDDFWYQPVGLRSAAGVRVTRETALSLSTFYACTLVLAQSVAVVPLNVYRWLQPRGRERATDHWLHRLLHQRPNRWQTSYQWRQMMQWHLALRYNAYCAIVRDARGIPVELVPLNPDRVAVERMVSPRDGSVDFRYRHKDETGAERVYAREEVLHLRGLTSDGIEGFSPLDTQRDSIGEALAAQTYSSRRMRNDARPGGVLEWEGSFKDDEAREQFRTSWHRAQADLHQGKVAVLERGMTWKDLGVKNTDLQFIELRKLKAYDICAMHRMPPHKVGIMEQATFSNIEHQAIEFVTDTMLPWFTNWEQELAAQLLSENEQQELYVKFLVDGLMRGDAKARGEFYDRMFRSGAFSPNDILELEDRNPVDGGDQRFVPLNLVPLDRAGDVIDQRGGSAVAKDEPNAFDRATAQDLAAAEARYLQEIVESPKSDDAGRCRRALAFYRRHAGEIVEKLGARRERAAGYCADRHRTFELALKAGETAEWLAHIEAHGAGELLESIREPVLAAEGSGATVQAIGRLAEAVARHRPVVKVDVHVPKRGAVERRVTRRGADGLIEAVEERELDYE